MAGVCVRQVTMPHITGSLVHNRLRTDVTRVAVPGAAGDRDINTLQPVVGLADDSSPDFRADIVSKYPVRQRCNQVVRSIPTTGPGGTPVQLFLYVCLLLMVGDLVG